MKKLILAACLLTPAFAQIQGTQAKPPNIISGSISDGTLLLVLGGEIKVITPDPKQFFIDLSGATPVLRLLAPSTPKPWIVDVFSLTTPTIEVLTSKLPGTPVIVTLNGLTMSPGIDYTFAGNKVTFLPTQKPAAGHIVQVRYQEQ